MTSLHDLLFSDLENILVADGLRPIHTQSLWRAIHRESPSNLADHPTFLPPLARWVKSELLPGNRFFLEAPLTITDTASSDGFTRKLLLQLADGQTVETVLMAYVGRSTACVSTQVGCAMGCVFCATGQMGFKRHLRSAEIVAQVLKVEQILRSQNSTGLRNLVLMGMGEPLHNYDAVLKALEILTDHRGIGLTPSRITISTVGVVPGILRLAEDPHPYNLAVSLHSADPQERAHLVPASRRWPLPDLINACQTYATRTKRRIFFEWTLIAGVNDSPKHAEAVATLLSGLPAHVNLIPLNPTNGFTGSATATPAAREFQRVLRQAKLPSTIRQRRGIDVAAGCGQLRTLHEKIPLPQSKASASPNLLSNPPLPSR